MTFTDKIRAWRETWRLLRAQAKERAMSKRFEVLQSKAERIRQEQKEHAQRYDELRTQNRRSD